VAIDAMGCRKDIAESIVDRHPDCVLSLKGNQSSLRHDVKLFFENQIKHGFKESLFDYHGELEKSENDLHG
jgi:predicted transposase YbfD/YdcC